MLTFSDKIISRHTKHRLAAPWLRSTEMDNMSETLFCDYEQSKSSVTPPPLSNVLLDFMHLCSNLVLRISMIIYRIIKSWTKNLLEKSELKKAF